MSSALADDPIIRPSQIKQFMGVSRPTVYRMVAKGQFKKQVPLSDGTVGWPLSWINEWRVARGLPPAQYVA